MPGVKGKSGRKSHYDSLAIAEVVNLSIKTVRDYLKDENIPVEKKVFVAKDFAIKRMPTKIQGDDIADKNYIQVIQGLGEGRLRRLVASLGEGASSEEPS